MSLTNMLLAANLGASLGGQVRANRNMANLNATIHAQNHQLAWAEHERQWAEHINVWTRELEQRGWTPIEANAEARRQRARVEAVYALDQATTHRNQLDANHSLIGYLTTSWRNRRTVLILTLLATLAFGLATWGLHNYATTQMGMTSQEASQDSSILFFGCLTILGAAIVAALIVPAITCRATLRAAKKGHPLPDNKHVRTAQRRREKVMTGADRDLAAHINQCKNTLDYWGPSPLHDNEQVARSLNQKTIDLRTQPQ